MDGERIAPAKKCPHESVKHESDVIFFFTAESLSPLWILFRISESKHGVVDGSFKVLDGCCAQEEAWAVGN